MNRILDRARAVRATHDDGTTMLEIVAGMAIMAIFLTMFSGAMYNIFRSTTYVESSSISSSQTNNAFVQLDKTVRYASSLSAPNTTPTSTGNYYIEFQTGYTGSTICNQLQLNVTAQTLKQRSWTPNNGAYTNLTAFRMLANGVTASGTPFVMSYGTSYQFEQLAVSLASINGNPSQTNVSSTTYVALNSADANRDATSGQTPPSSVCQETSRP